MSHRQPGCTTSKGTGNLLASTADARGLGNLCAPRVLLTAPPPTPLWRGHPAASPRAFPAPRSLRQEL
eukprot:2746518-Alexandrium_andersonii.AAC.1